MTSDPASDGVSSHDFFARWEMSYALKATHQQRAFAQNHADAATGTCGANVGTVRQWWCGREQEKRVMPPTVCFEICRASERCVYPIADGVIYFVFPLAI
jgi:hypothetical protein